LIGNDIVDLRLIELPPHRHARFLERVCTPAEARALHRSNRPNTSLAVMWASKEATYKLLSRHLNLHHFVPREFVTNLDSCTSLHSCAELQVCYGKDQATVTTFLNERWVHAVATVSGSDDLHWRVQEMHKSPFHEITPRDESEAARRLAKELLLKCGWKNVVLDFVGKAPTLKQEGENGAEMGISLSHHGAFVAVAIAWSSSNPGRHEGVAYDSMVRPPSGEACSTCTA